MREQPKRRLSGMKVMKDALALFMNCREDWATDGDQDD
jgi:hypothetical protein